jgi:hypothetical protein
MAIIVGASVLSTLVPILLRARLVVILAFVFFLVLSVIEMPLMIVALRQMARRPGTSPRLVWATFAIFVMFAAVYAAMFVVLTGQIIWSIVLAALCLVRFASGVLVR